MVDTTCKFSGLCIPFNLRAKQKDYLKLHLCKIRKILIKFITKNDEDEQRVV